MTECYYHVYKGLPVTTDTIERAVSALRDVASMYDADIEGQPVEIWRDGKGQWGLFVGDTSTMTDEGWERCL
ncbi:hypothetical protein SEA_NANOSMITE_138 [Mycobacterium phage Nanosmite]|nr:hypothetical protein SEA_NANOSMITE_138 [Mycobacterium phage Nanosmite]